MSDIRFPNMYRVDLEKGPAIKQLHQMFMGDKAANRIGAYLFQGDAAVSPGGSCSGTAILNDGSTVALTGSVAGNEIYIDLPPGCYAVPGPIQVYVLWTNGTVMTTVVAGFGTVTRTETGTIIDPGVIIPSVAQLISDIEDAVASIPADYSALLGSIAHTFSSSESYTAGKYVWYNGELYRFNVDHPSGAWIGTDAARYTATEEFPLIQQALGTKADAAEVADLKSALSKSIDVVADDGKKYIPENITWINGYVGKDDGLIRNSSLSKTGIFLLKEGQTVMVGTRNKNICCIGTTASSTIAVGSTVTVLVKTSAVDQYEENSYTATSDMNIVVSVLASEYEVKVTEETNLSEMFMDFANAQSVLADIVAPSENLADPSKFTKNKYMTDAGVVGNSTSYYYTNKIPVTEGDVIYVSPSPRYKTAFNGDTVVSATITFPWTVPSGIDGLIITGYMSAIDSLMVAKNKALPYIPYGDYVNNDYLRIDNKNALNGNNGLTMEAQTLEALTTMELSVYPKGLATHDRLTGYCEFSTLGEIEFGYGYTSNYFVKVDATNIYKYYNGSVVGDPVPHGLTITDYMAFAMIMDDDRVATVTINTTSGSASTTFNLNYSKSGLPFIRSSTALENVKLSAISADIRKPIWWFGDSYSSNAAERIIGQLNNYNVIDNMLVNAVPGMRSYYDANTGGYNDLVKLLAFAKPKFIIWTLGMNDTEANYKSYLLRVKNICDAFGIILYAAKIPSVPSIDNTGKAAYIDELGIRAIDWASAVNATSAGVWYTGYLSSDNVHPTVLGAKAMATRTLVDCPAIMQF